MLWRVSAEEGIANYDRAVNAGITSIMSKMGISTMQGYHCRADLRDRWALTEGFVDRLLHGYRLRAWAASTQDGVERECDERYELGAGAGSRHPRPTQMASSGITKWRPLGGEEHHHHPAGHLPVASCRAREQSRALLGVLKGRSTRKGRAIMLRDLLEFVPLRLGPVPAGRGRERLSSIVKRFETSAMSFGAISARGTRVRSRLP